MEVREYRIPQEDGEVLCSPTVDTWPKVLTENRAEASRWPFELAGWSAAEWRVRTRRRLWGALGERSIILTGHQPVFYHPGIWLKAFMAAWTASGGRTGREDNGQEGRLPAAVVAFNLNVDSDAEPALGLWLPAWEIAEADVSHERGGHERPAAAPRTNAAQAKPSGKLVRRWVPLQVSESPIGSAGSENGVRADEPVRAEGAEAAAARLPLERRAVPTLEDWERFAVQGRAHLQSLAGGPEAMASAGVTLLARWERFVAEGRALLEQADRPGNLARFLAACRQRWEVVGNGSARGHADAAESGSADGGEQGGSVADAGPNLPETSVSEVAQTPEFLRFALAWFRDASRLADVYNEQLRTYRRLRRIRSHANPFPDLRRYGAQVETPFWCVGPDGERADLFVVNAGSPPAGQTLPPLVLCTRHGEILRLDGGSWEEAVARLQASGIELRPKAVALTGFLRLFACDLFVHGVGGGRYDHITDGVMRSWLGIEPPRYAVVSAHVTLPLGGGSALLAEWTGQVRHMRHRLRDLRFNPQRYAEQAAGTEELAAEKRQLIQAIGEPGAPKRELTRRIEAVNAALYERLSSVRAAWEDELRRAEEQRKQHEVACARDYPYCLYEPSGLWQLVQAGQQSIAYPKRCG